MRKLSAIVLVAAATIVVSAVSGGSAYAGEAATTGFVSHDVVVSTDSTDWKQDLTGCGSHRQGVSKSTATAP